MKNDVRYMPPIILKIVLVNSLNLVK